MGEVTCSVDRKHLVEVCERFIGFHKEKNKAITQQNTEELNRRYEVYKKTFTFFKKKTLREFDLSESRWLFQWTEHIDTYEVETLWKLLKKSQDETVIINTETSNLLDGQWYVDDALLEIGED